MLHALRREALLPFGLQSFAVPGAELDPLLAVTVVQRAGILKQNCSLRNAHPIVAIRVHQSGLTSKVVSSNSRVVMVRLAHVRRPRRDRLVANWRKLIRLTRLLSVSHAWNREDQYEASVNRFRREHGVLLQD